MRSSGDFTVGWDGGSSTDGDDNFFGADSIGGGIGSFDLDFVGRDEGGPTFVMVDIIFFQVGFAIG